MGKLTSLIRRCFPMVAQGHEEMIGSREVGPLTLVLEESWGDGWEHHSLVVHGRGRGNESAGGCLRLSWTDDTTVPPNYFRTEAKVVLATALQRAVFFLTPDWRTEEDNAKELSSLASGIRYFG